MQLSQRGMRQCSYANDFCVSKYLLHGMDGYSHEKSMIWVDTMQMPRRWCVFEYSARWGLNHYILWNCFNISGEAPVTLGSPLGNLRQSKYECPGRSL